MMGHAKLSPSGASRWLYCTASVKENEKYEDTSSVYADEGTKAHDLGEKMLLKQDWNPENYDKLMIEHCQDYANYVIALKGFL